MRWAKFSHKLNQHTSSHVGLGVKWQFTYSIRFLLNKEIAWSKMELVRGYFKKIENLSNLNSFPSCSLMEGNTTKAQAMTMDMQSMTWHYKCMGCGSVTAEHATFLPPT